MAKRKSTPVRYAAVRKRARLASYTPALMLGGSSGRPLVHNKPELKYKDYLYGTAVTTSTILTTDLTNITAGTAFNQRIGRNIRVHKVAIRGFSGATSQVNPIDLYLTTSKNGAAPVTGDFTSACGSFLNPSRHHEWMHLCPHANDSVSLAMDTVYNFKYPVKINFDGGAPAENPIYLTVVSRKANASPLFNVRIYYTDD